MICTVMKKSVACVYTRVCWKIAANQEDNGCANYGEICKNNAYYEYSKIDHENQFTKKVSSKI